MPGTLSIMVIKRERELHHCHYQILLSLSYVDLCQFEMRIWISPTVFARGSARSHMNIAESSTPEQSLGMKNTNIAANFPIKLPRISHFLLVNSQWRAEGEVGRLPVCRGGWLCYPSKGRFCKFLAFNKTRMSHSSERLVFKGFNAFNHWEHLFN